jgi:hypothetical protein
VSTERLFFLVVSSNNDTTHLAKMYSRDDTVAALLGFYRQILKLPYIDESDLITPPASGWNSIDEEALRAQGKTDSVIDLLRHLPYIHAPRRDGPIIAYETVCTDYTVDSTHFLEDEYPLPGHCVYLTEGEGREGYCLILDTERGDQIPSRDLSNRRD